MSNRIRCGSGAFFLREVFFGDQIRTVVNFARDIVLQTYREEIEVGSEIEYVVKNAERFETFATNLYRKSGADL